MTYEEIQKYPVGMIYSHKETDRQISNFWYTKADKHVIINNPKLSNIKFVPSTNIYIATEKNIYEKKIDGWLFDGDEWHCVELTWDGYQEIDDEELVDSE